MQLVHDRGVIIFEHPRTRHRVAFRFGSRRALARFVERVTGMPDVRALDVAWQFVEEGRAIVDEATS